MSTPRHPQLRYCAAACLLAVLSAHACANSGEAPSLAAYQRAQGLRQALEAIPGPQRSSADYQRVLKAYRAVYHGDPSSAKADDSIVAVAELLAEEGRTLHSQKALNDAIGQYEFLRAQYPYSQYRFAALLAEGEIYHVDLADRDQAMAVFEKFLKAYPKNPLATQARDELAVIHKEEAAEILPVRGAKPAAPGALLRKAAEASPAKSAEASSDAADKPPAFDVSAADHGSAASSSSAASGSLGDAETTEARSQPASVTGLHYWPHASNTRIAIDIGDQVKYVSARITRPNRIYFDLRGTRLASRLREKSITVKDDSLLTRIRAAQFSSNVTRIVLDVGAGVDYSAFFLPNPWRLIIDVHKPDASGASAPLMEAGNRESSNPTLAKGTPSSASLSRGPSGAGAHAKNELDSITPTKVARTAALGSQGSALPAIPSLVNDETNVPSDAEEFPPVHQAGSTADGERSLARTLGLKIGRIVIDAGHGGYDCGSIGPGGLEEKDITLDVALRLGRLLKDRLGADVIYTRHNDTFIPLQTRTAIANQAHADLFISIHANSSSDPAVRGVESYYLNFTTAPDALKVAARENADSNESVANLSDLVKEIALQDKIEESREFAADVQRSLYGGLEAGNPGFKNRGVKKAPFVVLIGADMPSILAEISFLTNPKDARELRQPAYRQRIAESLYRGVARYINGLNGVRLAENGVRPGN